MAFNELEDVALEPIIILSQNCMRYNGWKNLQNRFSKNILSRERFLDRGINSHIKLWEHT